MSAVIPGQNSSACSTLFIVLRFQCSPGNGLFARPASSRSLGIPHVICHLCPLACESSICHASPLYDARGLAVASALHHIYCRVWRHPGLVLSLIRANGKPGSCCSCSYPVIDTVGAVVICVWSAASSAWLWQPSLFSMPTHCGQSAQRLSPSAS